MRPIAEDGIYPRCVNHAHEIYAPSVIDYSKGLAPCHTCGEYLPTEYQTSVTSLPCVNCNRPVGVGEDSNEAKGVFNVFCNGECEDSYAWSH